MKKRNLPPTKSTKKTKREGDAIPWRYCLITLFCGLFLVVGFFFAARQHFSSIDYGIKNSKLRKQIDELESEKRRLILEKEVALSPAEIKKAAKKIGLTAMTASNIEVFRGSGSPAPVTAKAEKISMTKTAEKLLPEAKPIQAFANKTDDKKVKSDKPPKPEKKVSETKKASDAKENAKEKTQVKTTG
jgi:hypothetical protein